MTFEEDVIEELLSRTEKGEPLTRICEDKRMPARSVVYQWLEDDETFAGRFHAARARGVHALAEECLEISDEDAPDPVDVQRNRLRIDTRLRLAGKWLPRVYGDKLDLTSDGKAINLAAEVDAARKRAQGE